MAKRVRALVASEGKVLLGYNPYDEVYDLPGGHIEEGEHPVDALLRELHEETGIVEWNNIDFLFFYMDNYVFSVDPANYLLPTPLNDPDKEFTRLEWFHLFALPLKLSEFSEDVLYKYLASQKLVTAGKMQIFVDDQLVHELEDDVIHMTLPKLAQERAKGKKVKFVQVLDDGTKIDFLSGGSGLPVTSSFKGMCLQWPVKILGQSTLGDVDLHITAKWFSELSDDYIEKIITRANQQCISPPSFTSFKLEMFGKENNVPVLRLMGCPKYVFDFHFAFSDMVEDTFPEYKPHITVPRDFWDEVGKYSYTPTDLNIEVYPLQLTRGEDVLHKWDSPVWKANQDKAKAYIKSYSKIEEIYSELTQKHFPDLALPRFEVCYRVDWLAKTTATEVDGVLECKININNDLLDSYDVLRQALAHEMIHHYLYMKKGLTVEDHGSLFIALADKVNSVEGEGYVAANANETRF
jgi:predicted SprT family Zn-dependent metalloprotease